MIETVAITPGLSAQVLGVEDLLEPNTGMLHRALPYEASSERILQRTNITGDEPWA